MGRRRWGKKIGEMPAGRERGGGDGGGEAGRGVKGEAEALGCGRNWGRTGAFRLLVRVKGVSVKLAGTVLIF